MKSKSLTEHAGISDVEESAVFWESGNKSSFYASTVMNTCASVDQFLSFLLKDMKKEVGEVSDRHLKHHGESHVLESSSVGFTSYYRAKYPAVARDRSFVTKHVYKWVSPTMLLLVGVPSDSSPSPDTAGISRNQSLAKMKKNTQAVTA